HLITKRFCHLRHMWLRSPPMIARLCRAILYVSTIFVIAASVGHPLTARSAFEPGTQRISTLTSPRATADGQHIVVSLEAKGELSGLITIELDPDGAGGLTGKWAMAVAYTQTLHADRKPAVETGTHHHAEARLADPGHERE